MKIITKTDYGIANCNCCVPDDCPSPDSEDQCKYAEAEPCGDFFIDFVYQTPPAPPGSGKAAFYKKKERFFSRRHVGHASNTNDFYTTYDLTTYELQADGSCAYTVHPRVTTGTQGACGWIPFQTTYTTVVTVTGAPPGVYSKTTVRNMVPPAQEPGHILEEITTITYSEPVADERGELLSILNSKIANIEWTNSCGSDNHSTNNSWGSSYLNVIVADIFDDISRPIAEMQLRRFRWRVPYPWEGVYFKIMWDIIDQPYGWDDAPPTASRSFFARDQSWEWTGPGNQGDPTDSSWFSPWFEVPVSAIDGLRYVVNARFCCMRAANYGPLWQTLGLQIADDDL